MEIEENREYSTIPPWVNDRLLTEILSQDLKNASLVDFNAERALPKGENYLSVLYRVFVEYKESKEENGIEKYSLVIKSLPEGEFMQSCLAEMKGFEKESYMYTDILPAMYRIINSAKGQFHLFAPRRLTCSKDDIIVMEDLKHLGYKMANRKVGLDLDHCKIAVKTLARFHAASIALHKTDPSFMNIYRVEGAYRDDENMRKHLKSNIDILASTVETWQGYEKYGEKLRKIGLTALDTMLESVKPKDNSFNVLNHGDFWVNNMLFRYNPETGKVEDVRFVDFQASRYSSPALDLQYFMSNCPNDEVRFQYRGTLLEEYYSELADYCKALGLSSELITLKQLKDEFEEKNLFGLITASTVLCVFLTEKDDMPDMKNLTDDEVVNQTSVFMKHAVSKKKFVDIFKKLLVLYENKGVL